MGTSILMASSDHNTNLTLSEDQNNLHHHHLLQTTTPTTRHDHHQTSRQSSTGGRRKPSSKGNEGKKKQPQRGMGVAQLERLRLGERWKLMTEINQSPQPSLPYAVIPTSYGHDPTLFNTVPMHLAKLGVYPSNLNQPAVLVQRVGNSSASIGLFHGKGLVSDDKFQGNLYGVEVGNWSETSSKELSSTPNLIKSYSDHCSVCHQKKRNVSEESLLFKGSVKDMNSAEMPTINSSDFVGLNVGNSPNNKKGTNQDFGKKASFHAGTYSVGTVDQGIDVVAVHRKASTSGGGSGSLFMEYEFFPSGKGGSRSNSHESDQNELMRMMMMKKVGGSESSSSVATAVMDGGVPVLDASSSIDLSLRLSY